MKATLALKQLGPIFEALQRLGEKEMPMGLSFLAGRLTTTLEADVRALQGAKQKLVEKYAVEEKGQRIIKGNNIPKFQAEVAALEATEITVEAENLSFVALEQAGVLMTPRDLSALLPFLDVSKTDEESSDDEETAEKR